MFGLGIWEIIIIVGAIALFGKPLIKKVIGDIKEIKSEFTDKGKDDTVVKVQKNN